jgi:hypothetical protein
LLNGAENFRLLTQVRKWARMIKKAALVSTATKVRAKVMRMMMTLLQNPKSKPNRKCVSHRHHTKSRDISGKINLWDLEHILEGVSTRTKEMWLGNGRSHLRQVLAAKRGLSPHEKAGETRVEGVQVGMCSGGYKQFKFSDLILDSSITRIPKIPYRHATMHKNT